MSHHYRQDYQRGFTLIELMLSMAFISIMLMAIALCILQMSTIYSRGETLRQVNQASRVIAADMQRTIGGADASAVKIDAVESSGRLCTGQFTYIWNVAPNEDGSPKYPNNRYQDNDDPIRFIRIADSGATYCSDPNQRVDSATAHPVELLAAGDRTLQVRKLTTTAGRESEITGQRLFTVGIMLGTDNTEAIEATTDRCKPPTDVQSDTTYCAVNEFNITVRAGMR